MITSKHMSELDNLRQQIDLVDTELLELIKKRIQLVIQVGAYKKGEKILPLDRKRWQQVLSNKIAQAEKLGLSVTLITDIWERLHIEALKLEHEV